MHFQKGKFAQDKLIMLIKGEVDDYIFDLRKNSPTYKKQVKINLKQDMSQIIFVPKGCAHGFLTKKKNTIAVSHINEILKNKESIVDHHAKINNLNIKN